jgi:hypothetical protein
MHRSRLPSSYLYIPALAFLGLFLWGPALISYGGLYVSQYTGTLYAFYMDGGQTLFGQVQSVGFGTVRLHDVYTFQNVTVGSTATSNLTSQHNNALTRPDNWLAVEWRHVIFFEKVGPDAKIRDIIEAQP